MISWPEHDPLVMVKLNKTRNRSIHLTCCFALLSALVFAFCPSAYASAPHDFERMLNTAEERYEEISDYTCLLHKKELVKGALIEENNIVFKYKKEGHFYMRWTEGDNKGQEAIFADGKYDNKVVAHSGGLFSIINVSFDPHQNNIVKKSRHPITEAGIDNLIDILWEHYITARHRNEHKVIELDSASLDGAATRAFRIILPKTQEYYGHLIDVHFHTDLMLPVKISVYGHDRQLLEEYHYDRIRINAGLSDIDFDIENPDYAF